MLQLSVLGLILSAVGLYGVIGNLVAERTKEFGIRMALGAQARDILWLVLRNGLILTGLGAAAGGLASLALFRVLKSIPPALPVALGGTLGTVAAIVVAVALLATWLPARRGTRVDPVRALRTE
ncbi:MAG TPA: FtsX-like permease family protein [Opitutaceae bacterium]|nr:FtsX-like permease family protein [Opitutaceae bacterium]